MRAARIIFVLAAIYGIGVLLPGLFIEAGGARGFPELPNPEYYYGFYGSALVWQIGFLAIARDPLRYRALIPVAVLEKLAFFLPCLWLWQAGRLGADSGPFIGGMIDGVWMLLFLLAWWLVARERRVAPTGEER